MSTKAVGGGMGFGKLLLYVVVFSIGGFILFNYYQNNVADYTFVPEEMQMTYIPADFQFDMEDENVLAILNNPHRYRREFSDLVYSFNLSIISHVANRMDLADSLKVQLESQYQQHHDYLSQMYFNDYSNIRDTTGVLYETFYENGTFSAVEAFNEVASKYTCFLINHVITTLLKVDGTGLIAAKGKKIDTPCGIAMTEGLRPMIKRLQEKAAIEDFSKSKGLLKERVERTIAELGTMEVRDKKGLSKQLQTKVWGFEVSSTDIEVTAISIMKIGFKLDDFFDINLNSTKRTLDITLPEPSILSHEVYPKIDKLDVGWLREVANTDLNANFNVLRREFRREAFDNNVLEKSKDQAREIMKMMFSPVMANLRSNYTINVRFRNPNPAELPFETPDQKPIGKAEIPF